MRRGRSWPLQGFTWEKSTFRTRCRSGLGAVSDVAGVRNNFGRENRERKGLRREIRHGKRLELVIASRCDGEVNIWEE